MNCFNISSPTHDEEKASAPEKLSVEEQYKLNISKLIQDDIDKLDAYIYSQRVIFVLCGIVTIACTILYLFIAEEVHESNSINLFIFKCAGDVDTFAANYDSNNPLQNCEPDANDKKFDIYNPLEKLYDKYIVLYYTSLPLLFLLLLLKGCSALCYRDDVANIKERYGGIHGDTSCKYPPNTIYGAFDASLFVICIFFIILGLVSIADPIMYEAFDVGEVCTLYNQTLTYLNDDPIRINEYSYKTNFTNEECFGGYSPPSEDLMTTDIVLFIAKIALLVIISYFEHKNVFLILKKFPQANLNLLGLLVLIAY